MSDTRYSEYFKKADQGSIIARAIAYNHLMNQALERGWVYFEEKVFLHDYDKTILPDYRPDGTPVTWELTGDMTNDMNLNIIDKILIPRIRAMLKEIKHRDATAISKLFDPEVLYAIHYVGVRSHTKQDIRDILAVRKDQRVVSLPFGNPQYA